MRVSAIFTVASGIAAVSAADCAAAGDYDSQGRYSCNPAHQYPDGQTCKEIDGCPLLADASGKPIYKSDCAAAGEYDDKGRYSCNPAHQYPDGQSCKTIEGCPLLCDASGKPIYKSTCAAPGDYDSQGRYSCNPAHQYPNGRSCKTVEGCPLLVDANGQPIIKATGTVTSSAAQPTSTCAAPGDYDTKGRYSCNPAHRYPDGQTCKDIDGCPLLCDASGEPIYKSTCAAPGDYDSKGRYSCNPAHQYPNGQTCKVIDGCPLLCDASGNAIATGTATSSAAQPTSTCAAPGDYDSQGRYSCNPAHQYPNGQTCKVINGCPLLCDASGNAIATGTVTSSAAQPTSTCAAPGDYDSKGRYSCNPAHQYPNGQKCQVIDGCPLLCDASGNAIATGTVTSSAAQPTSTCAAPGDYDSKGRYSCNPAHQYPNGQKCQVIDGCPLLCDASGNTIATSISAGGAQPTSTSAPPSKCAAPGDYDSKGRYSCNPAHQYPNGQKCQVIDGCPLLCDASGNTIATSASAGGAKPTSTSTPSKCAAPGDYDSQGRYSCNPAHRYPNGQTCKIIDGCPLLCDASGSAVATGTSAGGAKPTSTSAPPSKCAAPGDYDSQGRYSCNPAHQYPNGQTCKTIDGCPLLVDASGKPIVKATASANGNNGKPTGVPIVVNAGSVLTGGIAMVAAAVVAAI
ncbi:hypothetical protein G3M48_000671 [Beauveria asiatica]|uniref:Uncharacterized protein n=1 Tax=Beauveria asiatica TaxID=1069075 RepID=A0AAW0RG68_9HYPO